MIDPVSLVLVLLGTLAATLLQCGWHDVRACLAAVGGLLRRGFDAGRAKAELAHQIGEIRQDGLLRAAPCTIGDDEFDEATDALIASRSLDALLARHARHRSHRLEVTGAVRQVLMQASELAPVMGLAGTLLALGRLAGPMAEGQGVASAIGMAVTTTFYGLFVAHALFVPLAGMVERRARAEDQAREEVFIWLERQVRQAAPRAAQHAGGQHNHHPHQQLAAARAGMAAP